MEIITEMEVKREINTQNKEVKINKIRMHNSTKIEIFQLKNSICICIYMGKIKIATLVSISGIQIIEDNKDKIEIEKI